MKPFVCQNCESWFECRGLTWKYCMHIHVESPEEIEGAVISELDRMIQERQIMGDFYHVNKLQELKEQIKK